MSEPLDKLGRLVVEKLRDRAIDFTVMLQDGKWKAPALAELQRAAAGMDPEAKQVVLAIVRQAIDDGIHDFLFALGEAADEGELALLIDGTDVTKESDGLHGEYVSDDGWAARFSRFPTEL